MQYEDLTIDNIGDGCLKELFNRELKAVVKNICDINTSASAAREVTLKIKIKPNADRDVSGISIQASSKLAPTKSVDSTIYVDTNKKDGSAYYFKGSPKIFDDEGNVTKIGKVKK